MLHLCVVCLSLGISCPPVPAPQPYRGGDGVSLPAEHAHAGSELWGKPLPFGAAFVIFRNEAQSQLAELRVRFSLRRLPNSSHFNASAAATSCLLDDIWGGESARVGVDTPFNVTLRRRQTFFFTVSNCSSGLQL